MEDKQLTLHNNECAFPMAEWVAAPHGSDRAWVRPLSGAIDWFTWSNGQWLQWEDLPVFGGSTWIDPEYDDTFIETCCRAPHGQRSEMTKKARYYFELALKENRK